MTEARERAIVAGKSAHCLDVALHLCCKELAEKTGEPAGVIYQRMVDQALDVVHGSPEQHKQVITEMRQELAGVA